MSATPLLSGVVPALVTPFGADGGVAVDVVSKLVEFHMEAGVNGFYVCGNTGEGFAMTSEERKQMADATVKAAAGRVPVAVHVGACPIAEAVDLAKHAADVGAAAISSVVPTDKPNDLGAAVEYFTELGSASTLPFYVYWVAKDADGTVLARQYLEAVKAVPNLAGIKFTDSNFFMFQQLHSLAPAVLGRGLNAMTGPDEMALAGLVMGSHGAIGSTYNTQPKLNVMMHKAFAEGRIPEAMELQARCNHMIALFFEHCNLTQKGTNIVAGIKAIYRARGIEVGHARPATGSITAEQEQALIAATDACEWKVE